MNTDGPMAQFILRLSILKGKFENDFLDEQCPL